MAEKNFYEVVLYGVPLETNREQFDTSMRASYKDFISARRILKFPNKEATTLIRIRMSTKELQTELLKEGCRLENKWYGTKLSKQRSNLRRCYNCQDIGHHIAKTCKSKQKCQKCSGEHSIKECGSQQEKCANCEENHSTNSTSCSYWRIKNQHRNKTNEWNSNNNVMLQLTQMNFSIQKQLQEIKDEIKSLKTAKRQMKDSESQTIPEPELISEVRQNQTVEVQPSEPKETPQPNIDDTIPPEQPTKDNLHTTKQDDNTHKQDDESESCSTLPHAAYANVKTLATKQKVENPKRSGDTSEVDAKNMDTSETGEPRKTTGKKSLDMKTDNDPTYNEFYRRAHELRDSGLESSRHPFKGEIMYRYYDGIIGKIIQMCTMPSGLRLIAPCDIPIKNIKKVESKNISCCYFHHLAAEIRDTIDKSNPLESLKKWRTKNISELYNLLER